MEEAGEGRFVTFSDSKRALEDFAVGSGHWSPLAQGMPRQPPSPVSCGLHVGRAPLVPKRPPSKPHTAPLPSVLLLFQFNFVLVSLGSWPGDMDGSKLPANKRNFSRTVLVGL